MALHLCFPISYHFVKTSFAFLNKSDPLKHYCIILDLSRTHLLMTLWIFPSFHKTGYSDTLYAIFPLQHSSF